MPTKNELKIVRYFVADDTKWVYAALAGGAVGLFRKLSEETREAVQLSTLTHLGLDRDANMIFVPTRIGAMPLKQDSLQRCLDKSINESEPDPRFELTYYQVTKRGDIYFSIAGGHAMWDSFSLRMKSLLRKNYRTDIRIQNGAPAAPKDQVFLIRHSHGTDQISKFELQAMLRWTDYPVATDSKAVKQSTLFTAPPTATIAPTLTYVATPTAPATVAAAPMETEEQRLERLAMEAEYEAEQAFA
jgi:hypothetical protein